MAITDDTARKLRRTATLQTRYHAERDALILQAHEEGAGVREIARMVGMTHPGVLAILARDLPGRLQDAEMPSSHPPG